MLKRRPTCWKSYALAQLVIRITKTSQQDTKNYVVRLDQTNTANIMRIPNGSSIRTAEAVQWTL